MLTNFQSIMYLLTQKVVTKLSKIWVWDPGSEIRIRISDFYHNFSIYSP
jgi:hypothetical protein